MMDDIIQIFFGHLATEGYEPLLHTISGTFRFDVKGRGSWRVEVKQGDITVTREIPQADCILAGDQETFVRILRGEQNPVTAFMQGKVDVTGDMGLAQIFCRLFRIRSTTTWSVRREE